MFSESDVPLLSPQQTLLLEFVQTLTKSMCTSTVTYTLSLQFFQYICLCGRSFPLFCICCMFLLFESNTLISWTIKNNCPLFIFCVANGCRGPYCIPSSVVSFSCWRLFLTELVQPLITSTALLRTHSTGWDGKIITSQNTQRVCMLLPYREKVTGLFCIPFFVISSI